jgi:endonuclease/exonuclease/phosphatase family metal-dependent hydrolase
MLTRLLLVALIATLLLVPSAGSAEPLRILTYNIHHGRGTDGKLDLERIAKVIRDAKPDLVALNEVDKGVRRSDKVDQPKKLGELTGLTPLFEKNINHEGGEYGNAILSRFPIVKHKNYPLPSKYEGEQRGMLVATVKLPDDTDLHFAATHFDYRPADIERLASARYVRKTIEADYPAAPFLLAGDFNASPDSKVMKRVERFWTIVPTGPTFPAAEPRSRIDYVCARPMEGWRVLEAKVLEEPVASDHRPVLVVIERTTPTPKP